MSNIPKKRDKFINIRLGKNDSNLRHLIEEFERIFGRGVLVAKIKRQLWIFLSSDPDLEPAKKRMLMAEYRSSKKIEVEHRLARIELVKTLAKMKLTEDEKLQLTDDLQYTK